MIPPDIREQHRRGVYIVQRYIEKSLDLVRVQVHRENAVGADRADPPRAEACHEGAAVGERAAKHR